MSDAATSTSPLRNRHSLLSLRIHALLICLLTSRTGQRRSPSTACFAIATSIASGVSLVNYPSVCAKGKKHTPPSTVALLAGPATADAVINSELCFEPFRKDKRSRPSGGRHLAGCDRQGGQWSSKLNNWEISKQKTIETTEMEQELIWIKNLRSLDNTPLSMFAR